MAAAQALKLELLTVTANVNATVGTTKQVESINKPPPSPEKVWVWEIDRKKEVKVTAEPT